MAVNQGKQKALSLWDATYHWTHKYSLKLPRFHEFLYAVFTRQRGALKLDEKRRLLRQLGSADFLVIVSLSAAYFCSVYCRVAISVLAPELQVDPELSYDAFKHGQVVVTISICSMLGKLANGFIIDMANPRYMLLIFMIGSASCSLIMSFVHTLVPDQANKFAFLQGFAALNALFQSGIWTASTKFIRDHFRPAQFGKAIVILAVMGNMGAVGALLILNALVTSGNLFWFDAQRFASGLTYLGALGIAFTFMFPHPAGHLAAKTAEEHQEKKHGHDALAPSDAQLHPHRRGPICSREKLEYYLQFAKASLLRWLSWWSKRQFVLVAMANGAMAVTCSVEGLQAFSTLFLFNGFHQSSQVASQAAMVLPLGVAFSLIVGGLWIERLDRPSQADVVIYMLLSGVIAAMILLILTSSAEGLLSQNIHADTTGYLVGVIIAMFLIGFSIGYAFNVPVTTFALNFGGEHAALATATLSVFASCVGAAFSAAVGALAAVSWTSVIALVFGFSIIAWISFTLYYYFELVDKRKAIAQVKQQSVIQNLQQLVLHEPHFEQHADGPASDSSFFHDPTLAETPVKAETAAVGDEATTATDHTSSSSGPSTMTPTEKWKHLMEKYGPAMRPDANRQVSRRVACCFFAFFVIFAVATFGAYFAARTTPNFVFPFGDGVRFANKSATNAG